MKHPKSIDLAAPFAPATYSAHNGHHLETIASLREWEVLGARCGKCSRVSWLDKRAVERRWGNQYLLNLPFRLRCQCGNNEGNEVLIGNLGRG
jgi:hypothetical protein